MNTMNAHGQVIRCELYPLAVGDSLIIFSDQIRGTIDNYPHTATPGVYTIAEASDSEIMLERPNGQQFLCGAYELRAILGEWSEYTIATK